MKKWFFLIISLLLVGYAFSSNVAKQRVTLSVEKISELSISGNPSPFSVVVPSTIRPIQETIDNSTVMNCTTNVDNQKITAQLNQTLPDHCYIYCKVGNRGKFQRLSSNPTIIRDNINRGIEVNIPISIKFQAELGAAVGNEQSREIYFTLMSM